ncbi:MAG: class I SAM-dependent methyltransferase [Calditrichaeota bacterium]|nr:class I SAM-dependent methyltransferase [Calditrichota bacterium]
MFFWLSFFLLAACHQHDDDGGHDGHDHGAHQHANDHMHQTPFDSLVERFNNPERDAWQKPEWVIGLMGDLQGKTVVDIGAGSGYFSFPIAAKGARVLALDINQRFLDYIKQKRDAMSEKPAIETRLVPEDNPKLMPGEADDVIIVNTYHHIGNRPDYFHKVKTGLKPGGALLVIDYKKEELPHGPPLEMKLAPEAVVSELQQAGFTEISVDEESLEYQYVVMAR